MSFKTYEVDDKRQKIKKAKVVLAKRSGSNSFPEKSIAVKTTRFLIH